MTSPKDILDTFKTRLEDTDGSFYEEFQRYNELYEIDGEIYVEEDMNFHRSVNASAYMYLDEIDYESIDLEGNYDRTFTFDIWFVFRKDTKENLKIQMSDFEQALSTYIKENNMIDNAILELKKSQFYQSIEAENKSLKGFKSQIEVSEAE